MSKRPHFDWIAPLYDALGAAAFGRDLRDAQRACLASVPPGSAILVLGGGTGTFLPSLLAINPQCSIWYIDISEAMLRRAKKRVPLNPDIKFIQGSEKTLPPEIKFDVVMTFFFLDLFPAGELPPLLGIIGRSLRDDARWLIADFVDTGSKQAAFLLRIMYIFFRWTCQIAATHLPDWPTALVQSGWEPIETRVFRSGFIVSSVYRRAEKR